MGQLLFTLSNSYRLWRRNLVLWRDTTGNLAARHKWAGLFLVSFWGWRGGPYSEESGYILSVPFLGHKQINWSHYFPSGKLQGNSSQNSREGRLSCWPILPLAVCSVCVWGGTEGTVTAEIPQNIRMQRKNVCCGLKIFTWVESE